MRLRALCFASGLMACGGRSEMTGLELPDALEPSTREAPRVWPASTVQFPSLAEAIAVPEPADAPEPFLPSGSQSGANGECSLTTPALDTLLERIQADVLAQPAAERPFLRYISTGAMLATYCDEGAAFSALLDALPLLLNSLSLADSPARARVVAAELGLASVDLRNLLWHRALNVGGRDFADGWQALVAHAPQSLELRGPEADALFEQLGTRVPFLPVSELARAALSADVYYALLAAPATLAELRAALGIPEDLDRQPNAYWRALTTRSLVSRQDRLVLRYRAPAAGPLFWRTVDLRPETTFSGAFVDPLTRDGDESSVVYTLPNGLPAYFLADASGRRLNESSVLIDSAQRDFVPRTAPSCVRCHSAGGVLQLTDELRPYVATDPNGRFDVSQRVLIADIYPEQSDLDELIEADMRRIEDAWARAGVPRSRGPALDLLSVYDLDLRLGQAAAELFVSPEELRSRRVELPGALRVLTSIGSLERPAFSAVYGEALCALARNWRNKPAACP